MSRVPKLSDLQLVLLSHAAKTDAGNVFPLPNSVDADSAIGETKSLLRRGFLTEVRTPTSAASWRNEDNIRFGLIITDAGKALIGLGDADEPGTTSGGIEFDDSAEQPPAAGPRPRESSKIANVLTLLRRSEGVTLAGLVEATGWQEHTVRAAMTGLRKRGFVLQRRKAGGATVWFVSEVSE